MAYQQIKPFNQSTAGKQVNMCLQNVRLGYQINAKFNTAWEAWGGTEQHKDRNIPTGVDVPLYYSYTASISGIHKNYGHINVRLKDGRVWNDGKIYVDLPTFERAFKNVTYVGWGESVNGVKVIKQGGVVLDDNDIKWITLLGGWSEKEATDPKHLAYWRGKKPADFAKDAYKSNESFRWKAVNYDKLKAESGGEYVKVTDLYIKKGK